MSNSAAYVPGPFGEAADVLVELYTALRGRQVPSTLVCPHGAPPALYVHTAHPMVAAYDAAAGHVVLEPGGG